jgi:hypothetical protein
MQSALLNAAVILCCVAGCEHPRDADDQGPGGCPIVARGWWTLTEHCQPQYVGVPLTITQTGCTLSKIDPFEGWSGTVAADSSMTWSGPGGDDMLVCRASISGDVMTVTCDPECDVAATRGGDGCPDVSGAWIIGEHCQPELVGTTMNITQSGCSISQLMPPFEDWSGEINARGSMTWSGPSGGESMTCDAALEGDNMFNDCPALCEVLATRR